MKSLPWVKLILISIGIILLCAVGGFIWLANQSLTAKKWSLEEIRQKLIGDHQAIVHQVVGWGSVRYGFDDGSDWIEFTTDPNSLETLIKLRPYQIQPSNDDSTLKHWAHDMDNWIGRYHEYYDGSEFESHGTDYYLFTVAEDEYIRVVLARSQQ